MLTPSLRTQVGPQLKIVSYADRNFGLSAEDFTKLQQALKEGDQKLYERIFLSQFNYCKSYLLQKDRASEQDAYDATMNTLLRFRDLLIAEKIRYGNLRYLFTKMARQEYQKTQKRQSIFEDIPENATEIPDDLELNPEEYDSLYRAFKSLGKECQELLKDFYFNRRSLKDIAIAAGRTAPAVRKQKSRCVTILKRYFNQTS